MDRIWLTTTAATGLSCHYCTNVAVTHSSGASIAPRPTSHSILLLPSLPHRVAGGNLYSLTFSFLSSLTLAVCPVATSYFLSSSLISNFQLSTDSRITHSFFPLILLFRSHRLDRRNSPLLSLCLSSLNFTSTTRRVILLTPNFNLSGKCCTTGRRNIAAKPMLWSFGLKLSILPRGGHTSPPPNLVSSGPRAKVDHT